jgi:hypothetical protein
MISFLASYPKSGNTWCRSFLTNLMRPSGQAAAIGGLSAGSLLSNRATFDAVAGFPSSEMTEDEIDILTREVCRRIALVDVRAFTKQLFEADKPLVVKTHAAFRVARDGLPVFPGDAIRGVVLIVRDPRDVAVSLSCFFGYSVDTAIDRMASDTCLNRQEEGAAMSLPERLLSWSGHAASWLDESGLPVHLVRYEDLIASPLSAFGAVANFLGLRADAAAVEAAVHHSRFEELRSQEERTGFVLAPPTGHPFFRKGVVGGWREALTEEQRLRIEEAHSTVMQRLGYSG